MSTCRKSDGRLERKWKNEESVGVLNYSGTCCLHISSECGCGVGESGCSDCGVCRICAGEEDEDGNEQVQLINFQQLDQQHQHMTPDYSANVLAQLGAAGLDVSAMTQNQRLKDGVGSVQGGKGRY